MDPEVSPRLAILDPEGDAPAVVRQPQHADRPRRHPRFAFLARPVDPPPLGTTCRRYQSDSGLVGRGVESRGRNRGAPGGGDPEQPRAYRSREDDDAVAVPSPTSTCGGIAEDLGRTTGSVDSLQFDVREEAQRPAVRGPEGIRHTLRRG